MPLKRGSHLVEELRREERAAAGGGAGEGADGELLTDFGGFHGGGEDPEVEKKRQREALVAEITAKGVRLGRGANCDGGAAASAEETDAGGELGEVVRPTIPAGCVAIHHQDTLHGSGPNVSPFRHRRALVVHLVDGECRFVERPTYIYGRYKLDGTDELREEFFPTTWSHGS